MTVLLYAAAVAVLAQLLPTAAWRQHAEAPLRNSCYVNHTAANHIATSLFNRSAGTWSFACKHKHNPSARLISPVSTAKLAIVLQVMFELSEPIFYLPLLDCWVN